MRQSRNLLKNDEIRIEGLTIQTKFILSLLPVVIVSLISLTCITTFLNREVVLKQADETMTTVLNDYAIQVSDDLDAIKIETNALSYFVGSSYKTAKISDYKDAISKVIKSNDMVLGSGIWFEPNVYDASKKFCGPYWYKSIDNKGDWDGEKIIETWSYSNESYNYFAQDYYTQVKNAEDKTIYISEPYFDMTSGLVMQTCSAPIYSGDQFVGCVTIDIMLTYLEDFFNSASIGQTGQIWLLDGNYNYLYHPDYENVVAQGISLNDTKEFNSINITSEESGHATLTVDNEEKLAYWMLVPNTIWHIMLMVDKSEVFQDSNRLITAGVLVCIISVIFCTIMIVSHAYYFSRAAKSIAETMRNLSEGHFRKINKYANKKDEFGVMIRYTNLLVERLSAISDDIHQSVNVVSKVSHKLSNESERLLDSSQAIDNIANDISDGVIKRQNKMQVVLNKFDALSRQLDYLSINISNVKNNSNTSVGATASFDTHAFDELKAVVTDVYNAINEISKVMNISDNMVLNVNDNLDNLSANLIQTNLLALKSSAKAARFGEFGATTVAIIDEISKISVASSEVIFQTKDKIAQMINSFDVVSDKIDKLSVIGDDIKQALDNIDKIPVNITSAESTASSNNMNSVTNTMLLCTRAKIETQTAINELLTLYDDNNEIMKKSTKIVKDMDNAVEIINDNTATLNEAVIKLEDKVAYFKG